MDKNSPINNIENGSKKGSMEYMLIPKHLKQKMMLKKEKKNWQEIINQYCKISTCYIQNELTRMYD